MRDDYAMIQRGNPPNALSWSFPGGRVELGNTMLETAQRELEEETGIPRDCVLWHHEVVGAKDVIVEEEDTEGNPGGIEFHYAVAQVYGELLACSIGEHDGGFLIAGDDALDATWWSPYENEPHLDVSPNTERTIAQIGALRSAGLIDCAAAALPLPPSETLTSDYSSLTEIKKKVDGSVQEFTLECWEWDTRNEIVVGRWVAPPGGQFGMAEGSYSWGVWGRGVFGEIPVGAYRMHDPDGRLRGYRFDALSGIEMLESLDEKVGNNRTVVFHDLLLDAVVNPGPVFHTRVEDDDEVEQWNRKGVLSDSQLRAIDKARQIFCSDKRGGVAFFLQKVNGALARTIGRVSRGCRVVGLKEASVFCRI